jgi:effector-binding domain-containing protein
MIKIFIPQLKGRQKTSIRGFFYSSDSKKIFYDYLKEDFLNWDLKNKKYYKRFLFYLQDLCNCYNQESIFYINNNKGFIFYNRDKIIKLINRIYAEIAPGCLRQEIKEAIKKYGGITIYKIGNVYYKEIFY